MNTQAVVEAAVGEIFFHVICRLSRERVTPGRFRTIVNEETARFIAALPN
jgi:hypothetical protein